jgi:polyphosphate kinase
MKLIQLDKIEETINSSKLISRDLSWLKFNDRVFDQIKKDKRNIFEKLNSLQLLPLTSMNFL